MTVGMLDGKVALISGAARGQGEAEARKFAAEGARVVLGDVLDDLGNAVATDIGDAATYVHLDVSSERDWTAALEETLAVDDQLDVLVNNAGIIKLASLTDCSLEEYWSVIRVNQVGCFLGMRAAVAPMTAVGGGSIVNISSINGIVGGSHCMSYVASKFAIRGMTKTAAMELGPLGIRVNSIHPGAIDTDMARQGLEGLDVSLPPIPISRMGRPEEVAELALFLASDDSAYCTGGEFVIDGGWIAGVSL
jgi:3alpha(or 20beta)-hydroxysteroid dehydrogenase